MSFHSVVAASVLVSVGLTFAAVPRPAAPRPRAPAVPARDDYFDLAQPRFRVFTDEDGLPQNAVTSLAFDRNGYLWAGTKDGLARYNGRTWEIVELPVRSLSNWVHGLTATRDGSIWVATRGAGVCRFANGQWTTWNSGNGLPHDITHMLTEITNDDGTSTVWCATDGGLTCFDGERWRQEDDWLKDIGARAIYAGVGEGGQPVLWIGSMKPGLWVYEHSKLRQVSSVESGAPKRGIVDLCERVEHGRRVLYAGTMGSGVARWDGVGWELPSPGNGLPDGFVCTIREVNSELGSALWVGMISGLVRLDGEQGVKSHFRSGLPAAGVWAIAQTPAALGGRTVWLGTGGAGLARVELGRWKSITEREGLPYSSVYALLETTSPERALWVGTGVAGLVRYSNGKWTVFTDETGFPDNAVTALIEAPDLDGSPTVYAGTNSNGVQRFSGGKWADYVGVPARVNQFLRSRDGALLVGTNEGLFRIVGARAEPVDVWRSLARALAETTRGDGAPMLWIGGDRGLVVWDGDVLHEYGRDFGLPNESILCLTPSTDAGLDVMWVGTRGGCARLEIDPGTGLPIRALTWTDHTEPALPNNTVYQVREDRSHRFYLFTNKGIVRLAPLRAGATSLEDFSLHTFTVDDGLPSNECNTGASYVDSQGRILAGTISGIAILDPATEIVDTTPKPLLIESTAWTGGPGPLPPDASLAYDESSLTFDFTLLSHFREADTRFRTRLTGLDDEPSPWTSDHKKEYTSLPAGSYVFEVWGRDYAGNVSGPVQVRFQVRPAPWFTWWAYVLYVMALASLIWLGVRIRMSALGNRNLLLEDGIRQRTRELAGTVEELKRSERAARELREHAEALRDSALASESRAIEASRAKSTFLANMSHELRTPMNAILGFVQLMQRDESLSLEQRDNLDVISRSGEHLLGLINDVLSISKIEAGQATLNVSVFDLRRLLKALEEMFRLRVESKGLECIFEVGSHVPKYVQGDEGKVRQILINLLGNAVKFTATGSVRLRASWEGGRATFLVEDTGEGISAEELPKLFGAFQQTEAGRRSTEGTGLGLAISRSYAWLMDGEITVNSQPGRGSAFTVEISLPVAATPEHEVDDRRVTGFAPGTPPQRVLIVDDVYENRALLAKLLALVGFETLEASNGREAVQYWESWRPQAILMDMRMPIMDGMAATREIRRLEALQSGRQQTIIIALTASAFEHDRAEILAAGCDDFVPKPFRDTVVIEKLGEYLGIKYVYAEPHGKATAPRLPDPVSLGPALRAVAPELRDRLEASLVEGDLGRAQRVIQEIALDDEQLAADLQALARAYRVEEILSLIGGGA